MLMPSRPEYSRHVLLTRADLSARPAPPRELAFERLRNRAGLSDLHFHNLRHGAISRLFKKGLNTVEVSAISRHKELRMLSRYVR
jgi:integrase